MPPVPAARPGGDGNGSAAEVSPLKPGEGPARGEGTSPSLSPPVASPPGGGVDTSPPAGPREQGLRSRVAALEVEIAFVRDAHAAEVRLLRSQLAAAQAAREEAEDALASALGAGPPGATSPHTPVQKQPPWVTSPRSPRSVPLEQLEHAMDALLTLHPELRVSPDSGGGGGAPRPRTRGTPGKQSRGAQGSPYEQRRSSPASAKPRKSYPPAPTPRTRARAMDQLRELTLAHQHSKGHTGPAGDTP